MATTNFTNGVTLTDAGWFNDLDALAYEGTFPSGPTALVVTGATTLAVFNTVATTINAFGAATTLNIGNAGGTNTILGATTFSQAVTIGTLGVSGTATISTSAVGAYIATSANNYNALQIVNSDSTGQNLFATFYSDAGLTQRGQISYDRTGGKLAISGATNGISLGTNVSVTGTLGVSDQTTLTGPGTTTGYSLWCQNSGSSPRFTVRDDGHIAMPAIPTSSAGLGAGEIWSNGGVLTIV